MKKSVFERIERGGGSSSSSSNTTTTSHKSVGLNLNYIYINRFQLFQNSLIDSWFL